MVLPPSASWDWQWAQDSRHVVLDRDLCVQGGTPATFVAACDGTALGPRTPVDVSALGVTQQRTAFAADSRHAVSSASNSLWELPIVDGGAPERIVTTPVDYRFFYGWRSGLAKCARYFYTLYRLGQFTSASAQPSDQLERQV